MIKSTVKFSLLSLTAFSLAALPLCAAEKMDNGDVKVKTNAIPRTSKAERLGVVGPFHGTLTAKTDASITLKERVFEVTSQTKITKNGKPATLADAEIGQDVGGQFRKEGGKLIAQSIRFGEKPAEKDKEKAKDKAKSEKPAVVKPDAKS